MNPPTPILIPRDTVNDDDVLIVHWHHKNGDRIPKGAEIVDIETSKSVMSLTSELEGFLEQLGVEGDRIPVGDKIGLIHENPLNLTSIPQKAKPSEETSIRSQKISKKAQKLMLENGVEATALSDLSFVREEDVLRHLESKTSDRPTDPILKGSQSSEEPMSPTSPKGFFEDARDSAQSRDTNLLFLGLNYFFRNYLLNLFVPLMPAGAIIYLHRLRGVKIGKGCFIDPSAQIETAYPENITIGHDVRVTARVVIMTHIKAPHYLRETGLIPLVNKPVILEDSCFIGVNSVIMPGVTIGRASVVTSGSVVRNNVPPLTIVSGNPAKVVKKLEPAD